MRNWYRVVHLVHVRLSGNKGNVRRSFGSLPSGQLDEFFLGNPLVREAAYNLKLILYARNGDYVFYSDEKYLV